MNLVLLQLGLELRRSRVLLVLYGLFLACNFAVVAGWVGLPEVPDENYMHWGPQSIFPVLLLIGFWALVLGLVAGCVLADSPARRDRFLATRPLSTRVLLLGKGLFLLLAVVLPAVLLEVISVSYFGVPAKAIVVAGWERFLLITVLAAAIAVFAAHWKSLQGLILASIIILSTGALFTNLFIAAFNALSSVPASRWFKEPTFLSGLQGVAVATIGFSLTAFLKSRRNLGNRWLVPAFLLIVSSSFFVAGRSPYRTASFVGSEQESVSKLAQDGEASMRAIPMGVTFHNPWRESPDLNASFSATVAAEGVPADWEIRWRTLSSRWIAGNRTLQREHLDPNLLGTSRVSTFATQISPPLAEVLRQHVGADVHFVSDRQAYGYAGKLNVGEFRYHPDQAGTLAKVAVHSDLAGDAFRWVVLEEIPLGQRGTGDPWSIASSTVQNDGLTLYVMERALNLKTAGDLNFRDGDQRWKDHYLFALYVPDKNLVWFGNSSNENAIQSISAAKHVYGTIAFEAQSSDQTRNLAKQAVEHGRLLILRNQYLGRTRLEFESPSFALHDRTEQIQGNSDLPSDERIPAAQFARWFHHWDKISQSADSATVRPHLDLLLDQISRTEVYGYREFEPCVQYLVQFVPHHLDLILDRMRDPSNNVRRALEQALILGAREEQRPDLRAALPLHPKVLEVLKKRGWESDAREYLLTSAKLDAGFAVNHLPSILALDEPDLDSLLLDAYEHNPSSYSYDLLRRVPRLVPELERITTTLWSPGRLLIDLQYYNQDPALVLALTQGRQDALQEFFTLLNFLSAEGQLNWSTSQIISQLFQLPQELRKHRHNQDKLLEWVRQYSPSDFAFDPVFRLFVLKPSRNTI